MPGMAETLRSDIGPLPTWVWAGLGTAGLATYMVVHKKNQMKAQAAQSANQPANASNLGTVPLSNLTTQAQPMPIQMGDTFVNVNPTTTTTVNNEPPNPVSQPQPLPASGPSNPTPPVTIIPPGTTVFPGGPNNPFKPVTPPAGQLAPAPAPAPPPQPAQRTQTVCAYPSWCGSLWGIAQHFYGNGSLWTKIYDANRGLIGSNPNVIHPGQILVVP